jgi:branched-chain amino acid transport system ATP-binding protein
MADQSYALKAYNVSKNFGGVKAVVDFSMEVLEGERRALIGPNGAGKTTLFNVIAGELNSDGGKIEIFGKDITKKTIQQRAKLGLGRTYQVSQLFTSMTVEKNLYLAAAANKHKDFEMFRLWQTNKNEVAIINKVAKEVGLSDLLHEKVGELSHGQQRQLEIGMALAMQPRLIMLDEPAAGLSPSERVVLTKLIKNLPKSTSVIIIEHDMDIVLSVADRISVLNRGSLIAEGTPREIKENQLVQDVYLGASNVELD